MSLNLPVSLSPSGPYSINLFLMASSSFSVSATNARIPWAIFSVVQPSWLSRKRNSFSSTRPPPSGGAVHAAEVIAPLTLVAQQLADEEEAATVDGACDASGEGSSGSGLLQPGERRDVFEAVWEGAASLLSEGAKGRMKKAPPPASIILSEADAAGEGLPTRQLVRMLDRGMSKKEASKLARNRAEALL